MTKQRLIADLRAHLAQEPVDDEYCRLTANGGRNGGIRGDRAPPVPAMVPMTDAEIDAAARTCQNNDGTVVYSLFAHAVEAHHGIGKETP